MQTIFKSTKWKVISGYTILFLLSILTSILIYRQITRLIDKEDHGGSNQKLFLIGNTITSLYESEALSNAFVQTGSRNYFLRYTNLMDEIADNIDTLKAQTTRLDQQLRIDTISDLLEEKIRNLQDLVRVKQSLAPEDFYNKAIASIESGKDSIQEQINIRKRLITTVDSSYVKSEKRKRRWLFFKSEPDSVLKVSQSHHLIIDTLNNQSNIRNTDSVVNLLRAAWEDVQKQTQNINRQINRKEYALIQQSTYITDQLKRILGEYEKEEIYHVQHKQQNREEAVTTMIRIFAWIAVIAILLVIFFTFFILRDLSQSLRYRRKLETANQYTAQLLKNREKLIQTVTHDIKSPLSSIMGYIELLNNTSITERQRYFLKNMQGSSEHILKLAGNLLDLSKLENNKMPVEEILFRPTQLFREIADTFIPLATQKQLELNCKFGTSLNQEYKGDALRIRQIITNLLSNAVKYTNRGGIGFTANSSTDNKQIIIKIQDSGTGMTTEEQKIIFEEFTRLKNHSNIEGTGLGLTITLKLIQLLGGEMKLQSEPEKGSCFTILLPLQPVVSEIPASSPQPETSQQVPASGLQILLVDDDPLQLEMTAGLLEKYMIHPTITTHPRDVLNKLQTQHYDLVFSDIQMPEMNGFELVQQIRKLPNGQAATLAVIALSADSDKQEKDYLQAGFSAYLNKPFTSQQLIELIIQFTQAKLQLQGIATSLPQTQTNDNSKGYTLKNIAQFTDHDPEALKSIIESFINASQEHITQLKQYLKTKEWLSIARLAHKMLPVFRQLEAENIIIPLQKLEHSAEHPLPEPIIIDLVQQIIQTTEKLIRVLKNDRPNDIG